MKWENRDWIWLLVLMIFIMGASHMYKGQFLNLVSYASTFVSIALAFIAIYISVREATKADKIKDETFKALIEIRERIGQLDNKVSNIDIVKINQNIKEGIDEVVSNLKGELSELNNSDDKSNSSENELLKTLDDKLNYFSDQLKHTITVQPSGRYSDSLLESLLTDTYFKLSGKLKSFTFNDIYKNLKHLLNTNLPLDNKLYFSPNVIRNKVYSHVALGILRVDNDGVFSINSTQE